MSGPYREIVAWAPDPERDAFVLSTDPELPPSAGNWRAVAEAAHGADVRLRCATVETMLALARLGSETGETWRLVGGATGATIIHGPGVRGTTVASASGLPPDAAEETTPMQRAARRVAREAEPVIRQSWEALHAATAALHRAGIERGGRGITAALVSAAWDLFGADCRPPRWEYAEALWSAYYGGRAEAQWTGTVAGVDLVDMRSAYPSALLEPIPDPTAAVIPLAGRRVASRVDRWAQTHAVWVDASVETSGDNGPLPYRDVKRGTIWPTGTWRAWFDWREIQHGGVKLLDVHDACALPTTRALAPLADRVIRARDGASESLQRVLKAAAVRMVGGLNARYHQSWVEYWPPARPGAKVVPLAPEVGLWTVSYGRHIYPRTTHVAIGAHVNATVRIRLRRALDTLGAAAISWDTDGVWAISCPALRTIESGTGNGTWSTKEHTCTISLRGPRDYLATRDGQTVARKLGGVPRALLLLPPTKESCYTWTDAIGRLRRAGAEHQHGLRQPADDTGRCAPWHVDRRTDRPFPPRPKAKPARLRGEA